MDRGFFFKGGGNYEDVLELDRSGIRPTSKKPDVHKSANILAITKSYTSKG